MHDQRLPLSRQVAQAERDVARSDAQLRQLCCDLRQAAWGSLRNHRKPLMLATAALCATALLLFPWRRALTQGTRLLRPGSPLGHTLRNMLLSTALPWLMHRFTHRADAPKLPTK